MWIVSFVTVILTHTQEESSIYISNFDDVCMMVVPPQSCHTFLDSSAQYIEHDQRKWLG